MSDGKGSGVSVGCSNWDFLTGIIPVGGVAGVVAPGLDCGAMRVVVGMWVGYRVPGVGLGRGWCCWDGLRVWPH